MPEARANFLDLPPELSDPATARYAVLPIPFEQTVTYQRGTAGGPMAVIEASAQVEWFDEELLEEFVSPGIATYPVVHPAPSVDGQGERILDAAGRLVSAGKFLLALGGEHSITPALVKAVAAERGGLSVLQIDAHADLRDSYQGSPHSHACVMRRVLELTDRVSQVGIRSYSREEHEFLRATGRRLVTPPLIAADPGWIDTVLEELGEQVYVTVDIDGLDPSIAPGTGTPEPGGLTWAQVTRLLRRVCEARTVVAADITEVRPLDGNCVTEFLAARLAYKIIAYTQL